LRQRTDHLYIWITEHVCAKGGDATGIVAECRTRSDHYRRPAYDFFEAAQKQRQMICLGAPKGAHTGIK
jgi:hypothetical protein